MRLMVAFLHFIISTFLHFYYLCRAVGESPKLLKGYRR